MCCFCCLSAWGAPHPLPSPHFIFHLVEREVVILSPPTYHHVQGGEVPDDMSTLPSSLLPASDCSKATIFLFYLLHSRVADPFLLPSVAPSDTAQAPVGRACPQRLLPHLCEPLTHVPNLGSRDSLCRELTAPTRDGQGSLAQIFCHKLCPLAHCTRDALCGRGLDTCPVTRRISTSSLAFCSLSAQLPQWKTPA